MLPAPPDPVITITADRGHAASDRFLTVEGRCGDHHLVLRWDHMVTDARLTVDGRTPTFPAETQFERETFSPGAPAGVYINCEASGDISVRVATVRGPDGRVVWSMLTYEVASMSVVYRGAYEETPESLPRP